MTPAFSRAGCEAIVRRLWPYLDGKLPDSERERVTEHLATCENCTSHFDFARAFLDAVHSVYPDARTNDAMKARVLAALAAEGFAA
jgi:anti-sigma factor (TIGR02949 family)